MRYDTTTAKYLEANPGLEDELQALQARGASAFHVNNLLIALVLADEVIDMPSPPPAMAASIQKRLDTLIGLIHFDIDVAEGTLR